MVKSFLQRKLGLVLKPEKGRSLVAEQSLTGPSPHTFSQFIYRNWRIDSHGKLGFESRGHNREKHEQ
jgi:hypothetical protein